MAELITLILFSSALLATIITGTDTLIALIFGLICFITYAVYKKFTFKSILNMITSGVKTVKNILLIFMFIGMLTAVWRAGGTIAYVIYHAVDFINPKYFVLFAFLLCSAMSFITGTSFGTAGTMGVVCMTIAKSLDINTIITGGAIISGIYFGDRCSPMSSSSLLVSELTDTDIYTNIKSMVKTALIPFVLTCLFYGSIGLNSTAGSIDMDSVSIYKDNFNLSFIALIPALLILIFSIFKINVMKTMICSILTGVLSAVFIQHMSVISTLKCLLFGYESTNPDVALLLNGGGIISMIKVSIAVIISSTYFTIFSETGLLDGLKGYLTKLARVITPFGATAFTGLFTNMISCNQTLACLLTYQMSEDIIDDKYEMALALENTAIILCAIVPWSVASAVPLSTIGATQASLIFACYIYLVPLWNLFVEIIKSFRKHQSPSLAY